MAENKWSQEIEEALSQVRVKPRRRLDPVLSSPPPREKPKVLVTHPMPPLKSKDNNFTLGLFFVFLVLAVGLALAIRYKNSRRMPELIKAPPNVEIIDETPTDPLVVDLERRVETLGELTDKIWERVKTNSDRLVLTGTLLNNNFKAESRNVQKSSYIYLNKDWTINRLPDQLTLDPQDRAFLSRHLKTYELDAIRDEE